MRLVCTPREASEALMTSPSNILNLIRDGELPAYRDGRNYKIVISQLQEYIEAKALNETKERRRNAE